MKNFLKFLFSVKNEYSGFNNFFKTKIICILGLKIKIKNVNSVKYKILKNIINNIDKKYKNIFICTFNLGEIFIFLQLFRNRVDYNNRLKDTLFIATKKYHIDLFNLFTPQIAFLYKPELQCFVDSPKRNFSYKGRMINIILTLLNIKSWDKLLKEQEKLNIHTCYDSVKYLELNFKLLKNKVDIQPNINVDIKKNLIEKIKKINLDIDKFIFIAPEALSCHLLDIEFWRKISIDLRNMGYDSFFNITENFQDYNFCKHINLSVEEAFILAQMSKGIISLRSGFSELFTFIHNIPVSIIYNTPIPVQMSIEHFKEISTLYSYPYAGNNIHEFIYKNNYNNLAEKTIKTILNEDNFNE